MTAKTAKHQRLVITLETLNKSLNVPIGLIDNHGAALHEVNSIRYIKSMEARRSYVKHENVMNDFDPDQAAFEYEQKINSWRTHLKWLGKKVS